MRPGPGMTWSIIYIYIYRRWSTNGWFMVRVWWFTILQMDFFQMKNKSRQYHILVYLEDWNWTIPEEQNDQTTATWDIPCTTTMDAKIGPCIKFILATLKSQSSTQYFPSLNYDAESLLMRGWGWSNFEKHPYIHITSIHSILLYVQIYRSVSRYLLNREHIYIYIQHTYFSTVP